MAVHDSGQRSLLLLNLLNLLREATYEGASRFTETSASGRRFFGRIGILIFTPWHTGCVLVTSPTKLFQFIRHCSCVHSLVIVMLPVCSGIRPTSYAPILFITLCPLR